jgi:hypothetical protein
VAKIPQSRRRNSDFWRLAAEGHGLELTAKSAQIAKKTGRETKRPYGREMNGRGMNPHTSLGFIPLPFILLNFLASCEHVGLLQCQERKAATEGAADR